MINIIIYTAIGFLLLSLMGGLYRFFKGPSLVDKVVAFDSITISSLVIIGVMAYLSNRAIFIDVAIVYGLLSFLGVIVVARYIQGGL